MRNRNKKSDNLRDVVLSKKNPSQADVGEIFINRTTGRLSYKQAIGQIIDIQESLVNLTMPPNDGDVLTYDTGTNAPVWAPAAGGSDYTETIVNISSAQILAMGTTPIDLLPLPGADKYYILHRVIIEKEPFSTPYDMGTAEFLRIRNSGAGSITALATSLLDNESGYGVTIIDNFDVYHTPVTGGTIWERHREITLNSNYYLTTSDGSNPTLGDGTLRVKIYHKTITFGA